MSDFPETRESLLLLVRSPENREAWSQFEALYRPVIYRLARQKGLQDADANDLVQQVLLAVANSIGRWEKLGESVRFHHWLRRVARNAIINALTRGPRDRGAGSTSAAELLSEQPADCASDGQIDLEYRRELYLQAAQTVRNEIEVDTWRAFEMTVVENQSIEATAAALSKSVGTVYAARSRVMRRLRDAVKQLEASDA